ncbi:MAG: hypothetical protein J1E35_02200 [Lachnospiraceae bacterium]|nr:hypothetical protein [Lachnospiraceae bacterium]
MFGGGQNTEELTQSLVDAGCTEEMIAGFLSCLKNGNKTEGLCLLEKWRAELLQEIHKEQSCIEFLEAAIKEIGRVKK